MFVGQILMCLVDIVVCQSISSHNGTFTKCDEFVAQRPAMCRVIKMDGESTKVNCYDDIKIRYNIADNPLNKNDIWTKQELCDENRTLD